MKNVSIQGVIFFSFFYFFYVQAIKYRFFFQGSGHAQLFFWLEQIYQYQINLFRLIIIAGMIKVAIIDDHLLFSQSLAAILLANYPNIRVTLITDQPEKLYSLSEQENPDVILLDVHLQTSLGYDFAGELLIKMPSARIILLSGNLTAFTMQKGVELGVFGFLSKDTSHEEVWEAIQMVHADCQYVGKSVQKLFTQAMMNRDSQLSGREIEIVRLLCKGLTHKEIGEHLFISPRTVEAHRNNILAKLKMESIAELVAFAVKNGIA